MPSQDLIILIVQIIAALGVVVSVVYLGLQIKQQNVITKAQFGHSLTQRLYERYFQTSTNKEYAEFMARDWDADNLTPTEETRVQMAILTYLVDIFDVYDKVQSGLVDKSHLDTRMNTLKLGVMKTKNAKLVWSYWKWNRTKEFVKWFENEIYEGDEDKLSAEEIIKKSTELNTLRQTELLTIVHYLIHHYLDEIYQFPSSSLNSQIPLFL